MFPSAFRSRLAIGLLSLFFARGASAQAGDYTLSRAYNSYTDINSAGEIASALVNVSYSVGGVPGPPVTQVDFKYGAGLNSGGSQRRDISALLPPATWPQGWFVQVGRNRTALLQHWSSGNRIDGQYQAGGSVYNETTDVLTRLDPSFRSSWFYDRSEAGHAVGHRDKLGLGHTSSESIDVPPYSITVPWITSVPIFVAPNGTVTEVPHPNGQAYGRIVQDVSPYNLLRDNMATLTGVNESGVACGTGWEKGVSGGINQISFIYDSASNTSVKIPGVFGADSIRGASDINDLGEVVGGYSSSSIYRFWIYLPAPNYGLPAGTSLIYDSPSSEHSWGSQRDWYRNFLVRDVKITNGGKVIFPVWFPTGDVLSRKLWDAGTIRDITALNPDPTVQLRSINDINHLGQMLVGASDGRSRILSETGFRIEITADKTPATIGEAREVTVSFTSFEPDPIEILLPNGLLTSDPAGGLTFAAPEVSSVSLSPDSPVAIFTAFATPERFGRTDLVVEATAEIRGEIDSRIARKSLVVPPLAVSLQALPLVSGDPIVDMFLIKNEEEEVIEVVDENDHPISPKVEITFKNLSDQPITTVLQGLDPKARDDSALVGRIATSGVFPLDLGVIPAGAEIKRVIDLTLRDDGRFEFTATATGHFGTGTESFSRSVTGAPIAVGEPYPVSLELQVIRTPVITNNNNGAVLIQPGGTLQVLATVENRTSNSTLRFYGIRAKKSLNALGAVLTSTDGNLVEPAFPHDHSLDPAESVVLSGMIRTDKDGAPSGIVTWQELEDIKLIDDETGDETELTMDDVLVKTTGAQVTGWLGNPLSLRVIQDFSRPFAPPSLTFGERTAVYSYGALNGIGQWTHDSFDAIGGIGRLAGTISGDPDYLANAMGKFSRAVWEAAELVGNTWSSMTPAQKEEYVQSLIGEVVRRVGRMATGRAPFDVEDGNAALEYTRNAIYPLFNGVTDAYASDDPARISELWGTVSGNIAMELATAGFSELKFTKYVDGAEALKLLDNSAIGKTVVNNQEAALRAIKSGPLDESTVLAAFGPGPEDLTAYQRVFKAFGVKGYARERSPISYSLINQRGVAVWKPEAMKPKGISDIDLLILGDNPPRLLGADGNPIDLQGVTAIFYPESDDVILSRLLAKGETLEVIDAVLARAKKRRKEYQDYFPKFKEWEKPENGIPVPRNFKDNGVPDPAGQGNPTRGFGVEVLQGAEGPSILIPKMANEAGDLRYISGDVDWVHFSFLDGSPLDPKTAAKFYDAMMTYCGMQHPETITWINKGKSLFEGKIDQIAEYLRGEKALLEVSGEGPRAVRMSQHLTRFADGTNARNHLIFFDNGLKSRLLSTTADIETAFAKFRARAPTRLFVPFLWATRDFNPETNTRLDGSEWQFTSANGDELLLRNNAAGTIERFNGSSWVPWTNPSPRTRNSGDLQLTPTSGLTAPVLAGSTTLPLMDIPSLWPDQTAGRVGNWFETGQTIVIAPGEPSQEIRTIVSIHPVTLDSPLGHDHVEDTLVAVVPAEMVIAEPGPALITVVEEGGITSLVWSTIPGYHYILEKLVGSSWVTIGAPVVSDDLALSTSLSTSSYDAGASYRLRELGPGPAPLSLVELSYSQVDGSLTIAWIVDPGVRYQLESSSDLTSQSWRPVSAEFVALTNVHRVEIPLGAEAKRFFRLREVGTSTTFEILTFTPDFDQSTVSIAWSSVPGERYRIEASYGSLSDFLPVGPEVVATSGSATLTLPTAPAATKAFYRVRKLSE